MVDGFSGNYSLIYDSIGCSPGSLGNALIERFQKIYVKVTTFDYLNGILEGRTSTDSSTRLHLWYIPPNGCKGKWVHGLLIDEDQVFSETLL